jgi:hypothetical protein
MKPHKISCPRTWGARKHPAAETCWSGRLIRLIIDQTIRPNAAQWTQLQLLQSAAARAAEIIKAACPREAPSTPPARLEAVGYRVQAMLQAVQTVHPPLRNFYASLDDEQHARFNTLGTQIVTSAR